MDSLTLMDRLFNDSNLEIQDLKKGLTNQNFLLQIDDEYFVLRTPRFDSEHIVKRHHETLALEAIKNHNIDVETIYYDEASGYKVTRYIADAVDFSHYAGSDNIIRTANLMKQLHSLHIQTGVRFDPIERYEQYRSRVHHAFVDITNYEILLDEVANLQYDMTLCHNDWVEGNILFTPLRTYLIDYEYAADNDPLFDVMSFLTENNITDQTLRKQFYDIYFDEITPALLHRLQVWESFHNLLWCMWAMMMWEQRQEPIYQHIAKEKYDALVLSYGV